MKHIESKMNIMKRTMIMLAMVLAGWMGMAQSYDTIHMRSRSYYYEGWYDSCDFYQDPSNSLNWAELVPVGIEYPEQYCGRHIKTDSPMDVKGLSCMIMIYDELPYVIGGLRQEFHHISPNRLLAEYLYLCLLDSATMRMVVLDSVRWDTVTPKIMELPRSVDSADGNLYCYAYEGLFDKPVRVSGDFYIFGSMRNNVRITETSSPYYTYFPGLPTIYTKVLPVRRPTSERIEFVNPCCPWMDKDCIYYCHGLNEPLNDENDIAWRRQNKPKFGPFHAIIDAWMLDVRSSDTLLGTAGPRGYYADSSYQRIRAYEKRWSRFVGWNDGVTTAERLVHLTSDTVFTAYFEAKRECNVEARSNNGHWGRVTGGGMYYDGDTVTLEAVPERGFAFLMWRDSVRDNPRRVVVSGDTVLEALFILRDTCMVEVRVNNSEWGHVRGGGVHFAGDEVLLTAIAEEGYDFVRWGDGYMSNVRRFVAVGDTMFEAYFGEAAGIAERGGVEFRMRPNPTRGRVEVECGEPGVEITVRDVSGREVLRCKAKGERTELETEGLTSGVYFVTVTTERGTGTRKLVIER